MKGDVNTAFDSLEHSRRGTCVWKLFALAFEGQCGVVKRVVDIVPRGGVLLARGKRRISNSSKLVE